MPRGRMFQDISTLIFDLDGTISDPNLGIKRCLNYSLAAHGFPEVSAAPVAAAIGPQLDEGFCKFSPEADQAAISSLIAKYRERYAEVGYSENQLYPGVPRRSKRYPPAAFVWACVRPSAKTSLRKFSICSGCFRNSASLMVEI